MYELEMQPVLRCKQCNKPFDKDSTLKRHGYYCRSRRTGNTVRTRSCISCARGKARCDNKWPDCSRCLKRGVKCQYPTDASRNEGPRNEGHDEQSIRQQKNLLSPVADYLPHEDRDGADAHDQVHLDTILDVSDPDFTKLGADCSFPEIEFADFVTSQMNDELFPSHSSELTSLHTTSPQSYDPAKLTQQALWSPTAPIQTMPMYSLRSFAQRPKLKIGAQRVANLILHTLKSYPLMMLRDGTLPPFIHPHLVSSNAKQNDMESLNNCISLVHMLSSRINGSRKLFWRNVRMECERLCIEHLRLNKWELLAAMQALSIYILMRLDEGETDYNNLDSLLVNTVIVIAAQFKNVDIEATRNMSSPSYDQERQNDWEEWILEESARRLCVIYQVVDMLVYFEPAAMCGLHQTGLLLASLPAKKQLWEADNESVWKIELEREPEALKTAFGLATNGDLVRVDEGWLYCGTASQLQLNSLDGKALIRNSASWEEWCSGMDGLGGLVMLAASLVS